MLSIVKWSHTQGNRCHKWHENAQWYRQDMICKAMKYHQEEASTTYKCHSRSSSFLSYHHRPSPCRGLHRPMPVTSSNDNMKKSCNSDNNITNRWCSKIKKDCYSFNWNWKKRKIVAMKKEANDDHLDSFKSMNRWWMKWNCSHETALSVRLT